MNPTHVLKHNKKSKSDLKCERLNKAQEKRCTRLNRLKAQREKLVDKISILDLKIDHLKYEIDFK